MGKVQLSLELAFSALLGAQLNPYHRKIPEIRFALERRPSRHYPGSTYYVLGAVPEIGNAKMTQVQPFSPTGSYKRAK